jgi:hypothetical protein
MQPKLFNISPRKALIALLLCACLTVFSAQAVEGKLSLRTVPGKIIIQVDGQAVATYVYDDAQILRPHFTGLRAPGGLQVTRHHPPRPGIDSDDHASMHPGLWLAFGDISGKDFWRNKARVKHMGFVETPYVRADRAGFTVGNHYVGDDKAICEELCTITIMIRPQGYLLLWKSTFRGDQSFSFGDQEEMGLGARLATPIVVKNNKGGRILDNQGRRNEKKIWGKDSLWCDYAGPVGNAFAGITIMPDPDNIRPCRWHVRDYGFMCANPFGHKAFKLGDKARTTVEPSKPLPLGFGILIHSAAEETSVDLAAAYADYLRLKNEN